MKKRRKKMHKRSRDHEVEIVIGEGGETYGHNIPCLDEGKVTVKKEVSVLDDADR
jgi:hypothetical protein